MFVIGRLLEQILSRELIQCIAECLDVARRILVVAEVNPLHLAHGLVAKD